MLCCVDVCRVVRCQCLFSLSNCLTVPCGLGTVFSGGHTVAGIIADMAHTRPNTDMAHTRPTTDMAHTRPNTYMADTRSNTLWGTKY